MDINTHQINPCQVFPIFGCKRKQQSAIAKERCATSSTYLSGMRCAWGEEKQHKMFGSKLKLHSLFQVNLRIYYFNNFTANSSGTWNAMNRDLAFDIFVSMVCQVKSPFLHSNWCNEDDKEVPVYPPKTTRLVSHDTIWWRASGSGSGGPKRRYCWLEVKWWQRWDAAYLESIH